MFITDLCHEFPVPVGLAVPNARHWRAMELLLHAPWFLLSFEVQDPASQIGSVRTVCFTWESDLLGFLPTVDRNDVRGLVCMAPGWKSASGSWTSHDVHQIWLARSSDGIEYLKLQGADGKELDVGLAADPLVKEWSLTFELKPRK